MLLERRGRLAPKAQRAPRATPERLVLLVLPANRAKPEQPDHKASQAQPERLVPKESRVPPAQPAPQERRAPLVPRETKALPEKRAQSDLLGPRVQLVLLARLGIRGNLAFKGLRESPVPLVPRDLLVPLDLRARLEMKARRDLRETRASPGQPGQPGSRASPGQPGSKESLA